MRGCIASAWLLVMVRAGDEHSRCMLRGGDYGVMCMAQVLCALCATHVKCMVACALQTLLGQPLMAALEWQTTRQGSGAMSGGFGPGACHTCVWYTNLDQGIEPDTCAMDCRVHYRCGWSTVQLLGMCVTFRHAVTIPVWHCAFAVRRAGHRCPQPSYLLVCWRRRCVAVCWDA